ncbi:MAG TPA: hypothetical protein PKC24_11205, partial [Cyclobacteriaceae bacterium]|nr:hypothetical protein [Cyclobacteriaceae bacterium]
QRFGMHDLKSNRKSAEFLFESYLQLSGAVNIPGNNQDSVLISMYLQKNQDVYEVYAKDSGEFNAALLFDVYEDEEVLVTAYRRPNILKQVEINQAETYQPQLFHFDFAYRDSENAYAMYSNKKSKIDKAFYFDENKYLSVGRENENPNTKIEKSIDGFDEVVNFNEYYIFPSMQETIHEIIPHLQVRKQNQREILRVYIKELERSGSSDPLLIIDGVMTNDIDFFLNLNPSSVMRVSLINSLKKMEYFGVIGRNGIVVVDTKIPGHAAQVPRPSNTFNLMGLSKSVEFPLKQSPNSVQNRMPDIRSTLYWNGLGKTNEKGEAGISFFCSDDTGFYKVIAEGFTASGLPFHVETDFEVVFKTEQ